MANQPTFFWHDYETWGANPAVDRASQFAGIRTDMNLEIVDDPVMFYCRPPMDQLPDPQACLITGVTPQKALSEGLPENEFVAKVYKELARPNTCSVGYNSIRFDDEVSRYSFYRNFYDPYAREWQNGNSRWDVLDMMRTAYALRPEGIEWPLNQDGQVSFKLELLSQANGLEHANAHDALSDVYATIGIAKLIKSKQPKLFEFLFQNRKKQEVARQLNVVSHAPVLHVSGMFPIERRCLSMVMPLMIDDTNSNAVLCYDLMADPSSILGLTADQIRDRLFSKKDQLPDGVERPGLKTIHINKCPVVLPVAMLDDTVAKRCGIDRELTKKNWQLMNQQADLLDTLKEVFAVKPDRPEPDVDSALYTGFIKNHDKHTMDQVRAASASELAENTFVFQDERLQKLLFRYRARNYPQSLSESEQFKWRAVCEERLMFAPQGGLALEAYVQEVQNLMLSEQDQQKQKILQQLLAWGQQLAGLA